jgi:hypothetical protein
MGLDALIAAIRKRIGDRPTYVSFDLDSLDPSVAPGVSNIEPGEDGFTMTEASRILQGLRGADVIGADVVCLMPTKDSPNGINRDERDRAHVRARLADRGSSQRRLVGQETGSQPSAESRFVGRRDSSSLPTSDGPGRGYLGKRAFLGRCGSHGSLLDSPCIPEGSMPISRGDAAV